MMSRVSPHRLRTTVAAAVLSCFAAGGLGAAWAPVPDATAKGEPTVIVNRANKGDRLPSAATLDAYLKRSLSTTATPRASNRPPVGCEPVFSPIVNPANAYIYKRCAT